MATGLTDRWQGARDSGGPLSKAAVNVSGQTDLLGGSLRPRLPPLTRRGSAPDATAMAEVTEQACPVIPRLSQLPLDAAKGQTSR